MKLNEVPIASVADPLSPNLGPTAITLWALVIGVLGCLRFISLELAPFHTDEALFQIWAMDLAAGGEWKWIAMGGSSIAVNYGAGATWIYALPHLFSSNPLAPVYFHSALFALAFPLFFDALRRLFGAEKALLGLALALSSPFLFFFGRVTWDTTFFVPLSSFMLWCAVLFMDQRKRSVTPLGLLDLWPLLAITAAAALAANIQLAIGPFLLALGAALFLWILAHHRKEKLVWAALMVCVVLFILSLVPYALAAMEFKRTQGELLSQKKFSRWGDGRHFWWNLLYSQFGLSAWRSKMFWEPVHNEFALRVGPLFSWLFQKDLFGWPLKIGALAALILGPWLYRKTMDPAYLFGASGLFSILLIFQYLNIPIQAHYFFSVWWLPFIGVLALWKYLGEKKGKYVVALSLAVMLTNFAFLTLSLWQIRENGGNRGAVGTGVGLVAETMKSICEDAQSRKAKDLTLDIKGVNISPQLFRYLHKKMDACSGLALGLEGPSPLYRIAYASNSSFSARINWLRVD
jgi:hypothetical protein